MSEQGCLIEVAERPIECLTYPLYPTIRFENPAKVDGMLAHQKCPLASEISSDQPLVSAIRGLWEQEITERTRGSVEEYMEEYWIINRHQYALIGAKREAREDDHNVETDA